MLREIRIDEAVWVASSRARRADWRTTIVDLLDDDGLGRPEHEALVVTTDGRKVELVMLRAEGSPERHAIDSAPLGPIIGEYLHVIARMQTEEVAESSAKLQALDMAKKVVHDKGAKLLAQAAPGVGKSHETYRRLFTLVLSMLVDVTALPGATAHRRHAHA